MAMPIFNKGSKEYFKRRIRMIKAARLEAALWKDTEIALMLNLTPAGLAGMKQDPEYAQIRLQVLTGVTAEAEEQYLKDTEYKHDQLRALVPQALQNLYDLARSQNEHIKLKAAAEILDREGSLAKVSRVGLATEEQGGIGTLLDEEVAVNLLNVRKMSEAKSKEGENIKTPPISGTIQ